MARIPQKSKYPEDDDSNEDDDSDEENYETETPPVKAKVTKEDLGEVETAIYFPTQQDINRWIYETNQIVKTILDKLEKN